MSKQIKKGQNEKRLRIAVRFDGTQFALLDGNPLPAIAKDAVCELVLRPELLQIPADRYRLVRDEAFPILGQGSTVLLGVSPSSVGDARAPGLILNPQESGVQTEYWLVEATTINHAFTLISEAYETKRVSHTGMSSSGHIRQSGQSVGRR